MIKKQKILFISYILWGGGQEKIMYYLSQHLDKNLFEIHIAYLIHRGNISVTYDPSVSLYCLDPDIELNSENEEKFSKHTYINRLKVLLRKLIPQSIKTLLKRIIFRNLTSTIEYQNEFSYIGQSISVYMGYVIKLRNILSKMDDDTVIVSFQEGPTVQAWLGQIYKHRKYISYLCAPESIYLPRLYPDSDRYQVEKWMFSNACKSAQIVTVPNEWMKVDLSNEFGVFSENIRIIQNPVDCKKILDQSGENIESEHKFEGKTIFVQVARLDPQKNHDLTLRACEILKQQYDNFVIFIIGDGSEEVRIKRLVKEKHLQEHIMFLGALTNPYPYLKIARASILTSHFEASPLALVDGMLLGAVPISVDCIAGPAEQLDYGRCGLLIPPNDSSAFADAMYRIAMDEKLWQQLRVNGMEHAKKFDIARFVTTWSDMLLEIGK